MRLREDRIQVNYAPPLTASFAANTAPGKSAGFNPPASSNRMSATPALVSRSTGRGRAAPAAVEAVRRRSRTVAARQPHLGRQSKNKNDLFHLN